MKNLLLSTLITPPRKPDGLRQDIQAGMILHHRFFILKKRSEL